VLLEIRTHLVLVASVLCIALHGPQHPTSLRETSCNIMRSRCDMRRHLKKDAVPICHPDRKGYFTT